MRSHARLDDVLLGHHVNDPVPRIHLPSKLLAQALPGGLGVQWVALQDHGHRGGQRCHTRQALRALRPG